VTLENAVKSISNKTFFFRRKVILVVLEKRGDYDKSLQDKVLLVVKKVLFLGVSLHKL